MLLDLGDPVPIRGALEKIFRSPTVHRKGRGSRSLDRLSDIDIVHRIAGAPQSHFCSNGCGVAGFHQSRDDRVHAIWVSKQVRSAMGFFCDLLDRTSKIDVDHTDLILLDQPTSNFGHRLRVVVPNLHRERPRLVLDPPQPIRMFAVMFVEPHKTASVDHLGRLQPGSTKLANNLPKRKIRVARHGGLEDRWVDFQVADLDRRKRPGEPRLRTALFIPIPIARVFIARIPVTRGTGIRPGF